MNMKKLVLFWNTRIGQLDTKCINDQMFISRPMLSGRCLLCLKKKKHAKKQLEKKYSKLNLPIKTPKKTPQNSTTHQ